MAKKLPEGLAGTESILQPGAIIQLQSDSNPVFWPLAAPGCRHHLQLGIVGQVGKSPLERKVKHGPLKF
jgi:hypothetical protein